MYEQKKDPIDRKRSSKKNRQNNYRPMTPLPIM